MQKNVRTDLALESREFYKKSRNLQDEIPGIILTTEIIDKELKISTVEIAENAAAVALGKPIGKYITLETRLMNDEILEIDENIEKSVSKVLKSIANFNQKNVSILVVGLGNESITPDSLGSKVANKVVATRHFFKFHQNFDANTFAPISVIKPGVLGTTGIDTFETVKGIVSETKPTHIIAIDALAAKESNRIGHTIQISNTRYNSTVLVSKMTVKH